MFTITAFEIFLSECRSVLSPAQCDTRSERVQVLVKLKQYLAFVETAEKVIE